MSKDQTNSIRVRSESEYVIEVNDKGETISFDITDPGLATRAFEAFEKVDQLFEKFQAKAEEIDKMPDEDIQTSFENEVRISKKLKEGSLLLQDLYPEARAAMDTFLGEGACQKIFGDKNFSMMFDQLTEQLKPHLDKMGLNAKKIQDDVMKKHGPNRRQRRALK